MMELKVIGGGCDECDRLYENVSEALKRLEMSAQIERVSELIDIVKLGVMTAPSLMKDGKLAVIHDASLLRTAGADVEIEDLTAEALEQYPLEGTEQRIPLLEEVLPLFTDRAPLIVELKAERGNAEALAAAASRVLKKYKGAYCVESFDPRCLMWLWQNEPDILRGQLSENFTAHGDAQHLPGGIRWILSNLLLNVRTRPDFIAYRFEDRGNLSLRLCRGFYKVQEASWTVRDRKTMEKAEAAGNLVIFEHFDPRG